MANTFKFVDWMCAETLRTLINKAQIAPFFNTDYNKEFQREFAVGETVRVKFPQRFLIRDGMQYSDQPLNRKETTVTCNEVFGIDFQWDSVERALKMERSDAAIKEEYLDPAAEQLAAELDARCSLFAYQNTNNVVGSLGTVPTSMQTYGGARTRLNENSCPTGDRGMIISPSMEETIVANTTTIFNPTSEISRQYKDGSMGRAAGFDWYSSNQLYDHTAGTWTGTTLAAAVATGATSCTVTMTAGDTCKKGDIFKFGSVNNANPVTRRSVGRAKTFVVTQDLTAVGGGTDVINFYPPVEGPGSQYQNVDVLPANGATLTLWPGTVTPNGLHGVQGLALTKGAFALVGVPMEMPKGSSVEISRQMRDPKTGLAVAFVRQFDGRTRTMINRFDMLIGKGVLYADNAACRVASLT